jgi:tripartite-type tricarboxylate transporter receptor subunit TctC
MVRKLAASIALAAAWPLAAFAQANPWPSRTLTIVVPFMPGTGADVIARLLTPGLDERLKVPVVVENKVGASGAIGTGTVAKSAPDGYTLLFTATAHSFPDVPTMKELGLSSLVVDTWYGLYAPAGTPPEIVARLNRAVDALLGEPALREALAKQGPAAVVDKPERLGTLLERELARWNRVVTQAKIGLD